MEEKKCKCPFCGEELKPTRKNCRKGNYSGTYFTKCKGCDTDILIGAEDIDWETVE